MGYFNLARGLGILFVLFGHSVSVFYPKTGYVAEDFAGIGTIFGGGVMAMFFMISGYGFYKRRLRKCVSIQTKLLLTPYCLTAVSVLLTKAALAIIERRSFFDHGGEYVLTYLLGLNAEGGGRLAGIPIESVGIFWFVLSLMNGWILYNCILMLKKGRIRMLLIVCCVFGGYFLTELGSVWPYCIHTSLMVVGYLAVGRWIREKGLLEKTLKPQQYMLMILPVVISMLWGSVDMLSGIWKLGILDVISTYCLGFLMMRYFVRLAKQENRGRMIKFFEAVGLNSIWILCLHAYEKVIFPWYRLALWMPSHPVFGSLLCLVLRSLVIFVLYRLVRWIYRQRKRRKWKNRPKIVIDTIEE